MSSTKEEAKRKEKEEKVGKKIIKREKSSIMKEGRK
jgi:hypothetical protein